MLARHLFLKCVIGLIAGDLLVTTAFARSVDLDAITTSVEINSESFPVYDHGEGTPVLLLHGFPDSKYVWRHQIEPLVDAGYRVIVPDLRGYGDAPRPDKVEDYALSLVLKDLTGLLDALEIERAHVVGHDWGGTVAWLFSGNHPERTISVTGMTVGAPGARGRRSIEQLEKFWYVFFFQSKGVAEEWLRRDNWQGLRQWSRGAGDFDQYVEHLSRPGALTAGLNWYRANFTPASLNSTSVPPRIKVPAMGLAAENDVFLLEGHTRNSKDMIDASWEYHLVKHASHWLMLDEPDEVTALLLAFFAKHDG